MAHLPQHPDPSGPSRAARHKAVIAVVWAQFGAYHVDRCEALGRRLSGHRDVLAVEVASASTSYAWQPSGAIAGGAEKVTLFPGRRFEDIPQISRLVALTRVLRRCETVFLGLGYGTVDAVILAWVLRLLGVRVVLMTDSKAEDRPRNVVFEAIKRAALWPHRAAIVAGQRQIDYLRGLGFRRRPVLPGYDGVSVARVRLEAGCEPAPDGTAFADRPFLFVGRFVEKKNIPVLIDAYAAYIARAGTGARPLHLAGSGPLDAALKAKVERLGLGDKIRFLGFLDSAGTSRAMGGALALILPSTVEQWGLVVNEAVAVGLPILASFPVGARDLLVRDGVNGFSFDPADHQAIAAAMHALAGDEALWRRMATASRDLAWLGDCDRLVDAVEVLLDPTASAARAGVDRVLAAFPPAQSSSAR
ncbi:glycosyl transferase family 1 [Novosphingobium kunmingense]|uniref:Glycosyl transferase family 1 n=1 Tax=Novosphingobium kunmingense TaxID=1211806 RepID=A0A2N0HK17_9SPHN|nr:glycosyltransferase [Novosphingobium kunmingense]PKB19296.1 glycosyl transferase family 1 [Novosphingobium kunmingense]